MIGIWDFGFWIGDWGFAIWDLGFGIWDLGFAICGEPAVTMSESVPPA
jgi:hypothetical protein